MKVNSKYWIEIVGKGESIQRRHQLRVDQPL